MAFPSPHTPNFLNLVDVKLNGANYEKWLTTVCMILLGLELYVHVDGTYPPPLEFSTSSPGGLTSNTFVSSDRNAWHAANHRAIAVICQSCELDVRMDIGHFATAREMWEHLRHMFEQSSSAGEYAVLQDIAHVQQRERSVREYVTELRSLWRQLDSLEPPTCLTCTCCQSRAQS